MCLPIRILGCLLLCFSALVPSAPGEELEDRVFELPPDWLWMGQTKPGGADEASPKSLAPDGSEKSEQQLAAEQLAGLPRYSHVIPALGADPPHDVRGLLEKVGITFGEKCLALSGVAKSRTGHVLFVRNTTEQLALIDTLFGYLDGDGLISHARITFRWEEESPSGRNRLLMERTLLCRHAHQAKFQRHRDNDLLEEIEIEVNLMENGTTVDLNSACDIRSGRLRLKTQIQTRLTSGDPEFLRLATARGTRRGSVAELSARAERYTLPLALDSVSCPPYTELTRLIGEQITAAEQRAPAPLSDNNEGDLFWLQEFWGFTEYGARHTAPSLARLHSTELRDVRDTLKEKGISLDADDRAWYAPQSGLLYLHAGRQARILTAGFVETLLTPELQTVEGIFEAERDKHGKAHAITRRTLIVRSGQQASIKSPIQGAPDEQLEAEVWLTEDKKLADFNVAFNHYPVGRDTWSYWGQTHIGLDGKSTVPLVSGRSADSGGALRTISLRARLSVNSWLALVQDPERKAEAIRQIEAALPAGK